MTSRAVVQSFEKLESLAAQGSARDERPIYSRCKRLFDVAVAAAALLVFSPVFLVIAAAVRLDSPGPILFCQDRIGLGGQRFKIFKFRSMRTSAPRYRRSPTSISDGRVTQVGRILRRCSLDELPQLFNVLRGEMSLVGPRPEMPFIVRKYRPEQRARLAVVPGITGLWQISPARAFPIHEHIEYDLRYIAKRSFLLDLAILARTLNAVVRGVGAS
jgi:lipopolysaccharide/colanic/teichoic acid biosynthesis glycosyltransferase